MCSPAVLMACVTATAAAAAAAAAVTEAAAAMLWLSLFPLAVPDWLTGDQLIGGSPGGAHEGEEDQRRG